MPRNIIVFAAAAVIILCSISFGFCEDLTITTYYPSPNGSYRDLQITNRLDASGTPVGGAGNNAVINVVNNSTVNGTSAIQGSTGGVSGALGAVGPGGQQYGVYGQSDGAVNHYAGYFQGNIHTVGRVTASGDIWSNYNPTTRIGCLQMSFGTNSGVTSCPGAFPHNPALMRISSVDPSGNPSSGIMYCCGTVN